MRKCGALSETSNPPGGAGPAVSGARLPYPVLLISALVAGLAIAAAVFAAPAEFRVPLAIGALPAAMLWCAAVTAAVHYREQAVRARAAAAAADELMTGALADAQARISEAQQRFDNLDMEAQLLVDARASEARQHVEAMESEARQHVEAIENEARQHIEAVQTEARLRVEAVENEALRRIEEAEQAARVRAEETEQATRQRVERLEAGARQRIDELERLLAEKARDAKEVEHRRAAAMAAFAGAAGRMQAMSTSMLAELREMEHRHGDPQVLADLLELDHRTAQAGRLADSIAVLSGARSGRRWAKPIAMESILRGAMGRVAGYQRIRLRAIAEIAIAGHAAEGIMHALAELLDNACNFSPPTTEVHVYAAEVPAGVVITIEDSGLVMSESALRRAELTVCGQTGSGADLASLSGTRLGLAVVGHLARKHELTVSYRPSAIGGTAVVVVVPRELTTRLDRTPGAQPAAHTATLATALAATSSTRLRPVSAAALDGPPATPALAAAPALPDPAATPALAAAVAPTAPAAAPAPTVVDVETADRGTRANVGMPADTGQAVAVGMSADAGQSTAVGAGESAAMAAAIGREPSSSLLASVIAVDPETPVVLEDPVSRQLDETAGGGVFGPAVEVQAGSGGMRLPKRKRGQALAAAHPQGLSGGAGVDAPVRPAGSPSALGAFQRAVRENSGGAPTSPSPDMESEL